MQLTRDNPARFKDSADNEYSFCLFRDLEGNVHLAIDIKFAPDNKGNSLSYCFAQPIKNNKIDWEAYPIDALSPRKNIMPFEAIYYVERLVKLRAFI